MKKYRLSNSCVCLIALLLSVFSTSCQKKGVARLSENQMIPVVSQQKTNNQYVVFCNMGHDASTCKGCIAIDGVMYHVDCQGAGEACRKSSCMSLVSTGTSLYATTVDTFGFTSLDFLNMPARSFALEVDEGVYSYLNIPAQLVFRDTATMQFTFTGLSFTNRPLY